MRRLILVLSLFVLVLAAPAQGSVPHVVAPGETLWSIASAHNFTTRALAAANGLSENSSVVLGTTIKIPTVAEASAAMQAAGMTPAPGAGTTTPSAISSSAPEAMGAYTVQPGDTLTGLAARSGVAVGQIAFMNGLAKDAQLLAGTVLKLPTGAPGTATQGTTAPVQAAAAPNAPPYPTPVRVSAAEIAQIAAENGVPASLASAIAWQESGFNNAMVSGANARGVMQVMPGTWAWIRDNLASGPLDPSSAHDNVRAGVLFLGSLLRDTGGDPAKAVAGYYQGLGSVRTRGMLPETEQYVNNVLALRGRFGG